MFMTWFATGNNVSVLGDTACHICHIRLESPEERPEERSDFRRPNLLAWVGENRLKLLAAALTILRAYVVAGRPDMKLTAWGSFEGWSALVRSAVVWVGLDDPGETRMILQNSADLVADHFAVILAGWEQMDPDRHGLTAAEVIDRLKPGDRKGQPSSPPPTYCADMRDALEGLLGKLDARALGNKLRAFRRRVFHGRFFDRAGTAQRAVRWAVYPASHFGQRAENTHQTHDTHFLAGESGESGESFSRDAEWPHGDAWEGND